MSSITYSFQPRIRFVSDRSCSFKYLKPVCRPRFPSSNSVLSSVTMPRRGLPRRNSLLGTKTMSELAKASAFRDPDGDERVRVLEEEDFIDGSSEFRGGSGFSRCAGLESLLNRLVGTFYMFSMYD